MLFVLFVLANVTSATHQAGQTSSSVITPNAGESPSSGPTEPTVHTPEKEVWEGEIHVKLHESFSLNKRSMPTEPSGFEITFGEEPGETFTTYGDGGRVAQLQGRAKPSLSQCQNALAAYAWGRGEAQLAPASAALGSWICAETNLHLIARLRFDHVSGNRFTFLSIVYRPRR